MSIATNRRGFIAFFLVIALVAAGSYGYLRYRAPATDHAVQLVPADARAYLHVFLKPSTSQRRSLQSLLERFPETDDEEEAESFVSELLRDVLARFDVVVGADADEWLGNEAAAFLPNGSDGDAVVILAVDDRAAALEALAPAIRSVEEDVAIDYVDGFVVIGKASGVAESVATTSSTSLADSKDFAALTEPLSDHRIALAYLTADARFPAQRALGHVIPQKSELAVTLSAREDGVSVDMITSQLYPAPLLSGYVQGSLAGVAGALDVELWRSARAQAALAAGRRFLVDAGLSVEPQPGPGFSAKMQFPLPELNVARRGRTIEVRAGAETAEIPASLRDEASSRAGFHEGELQAVIDASALPTTARNPLISDAYPPARPLLRQILTVDLGFSFRGSLGLNRLVLTFSDA